MAGIAVVVSTVATPPGVPLPGTVVELMDGQGRPAALGTVNKDGYLLFPSVPDTFSGTVILSGAAKYYEQPVTWSNPSHITLRIGASQSNPGDIQLPAAVPF